MQTLQEYVVQWGLYDIFNQHYMNFEIYVEREDEEFGRDIVENGIKTPLIVDQNKTIISGHRRWRVAKKHNLMIPYIEKTYETDEERILDLIRHNNYRRKLPIELHREGSTVKTALAKIARINSIANLKQNQDRGDKFVTSAPIGKVRDRVGEVLGISGVQWQKIEYIYDRRDEYPKVVKRLNRWEAKEPYSIHRAYNLIRGLEKREEEILPSEWDRIIKEFFENNIWLRSFVDYPNRGPFGSETFRGNASGWLLAQLIRHFEPEVIFDPMEGSGTSGDVCNAMKIKYVGNDLKNPDGYDLISVEEDRLPINCLTYLHPPYHNIIKYSDNLNDLSNQPTYEHFIKKLYVCVDKLLPNTKRLVLLVGDIFDKETFEFNSIGGDTYNEYKERILWRLIKTQHSVSSGFADYALKTKNPYYIPLRHEDVLILKGDLND